MTTTTLIMQHGAGAAPLLAQLARYTAMAALLLVFRPLLMGLLRAAVLVVRPRLSRDERAARAHMRAMQNMINSSSGPSHAAELRAIAARA